MDPYQAKLVEIAWIVQADAPSILAIMKGNPDQFPAHRIFNEPRACAREITRYLNSLARNP